MNNLINLDQICKVTIHHKMVNIFYVYVRKSKFLWWKAREGFRDWFHERWVSTESILKDTNVFIEGENVYYKPNLDMHLTNGNTSTKFFETKEELDDFVKSYILTRNYIEVS